MDRRYPPLSASSLRRHRDAHIPTALAKAEGAKEATRADDLLDHLRALRTKSVSILLKAEESGDLRTALLAVREARVTIETLLEVEGWIRQAAGVDILIAHPDWPAARDALSYVLSMTEVERLAYIESFSQPAPHAGNDRPDEPWDDPGPDDPAE